MFRYNENIRDLLSARDEYLDLREDPVKVRKGFRGYGGLLRCKDTGGVGMWFTNTKFEFDHAGVVV